jgi:GT2 family glycosyltransferase
VTSRLIRAGGPDPDPTAMPVVSLVHNEVNILPAFLDHYRRLCRPAFLIVDDRSTDGSAELLSDAPDVTLFRPAEGSTYATDKVSWRGEILDSYSNGRWCLVPDVDEHFVFSGLGTRSLGDYIAALDREGAEAVVTLMLDMYADRPLAEHVFAGGDAEALRAAFPWFDGPEHYWMRPISQKNRRRFPTPPVQFGGGFRQRFYPGATDPGRISRWIRARWLSLDRPVNDAPLRARMRRLARAWAGFHRVSHLNLTKLGLIRWRRGLRFSGGAHRVTAPLPVSESLAVFLHYPFTRGRARAAQVIARGQHTAGSLKYYRAFDDAALLARSPHHAGSRRYDGPASLRGMLRDIPRR